MERKYKVSISIIFLLLITWFFIKQTNDKKEIEVISSFLPKQLSEQETKKICEEAIKSSGASSMKDMGKVMGVLKSKHADTLDFSKVSSIIKDLLK